MKTGLLFPDDEPPTIPPAMRRAMRKLNAADMMAAFQLADELARVFRPAHDPAGLGTLGDASRVFFGLKFENACARFFQFFAGLRADAPAVPPEMLPSADAVAKARRLWARHLLSRLENAKRLLKGIDRR